MVATGPIPAGEHVPTADQRVLMHAVPWAHFEAQLALRGDAAAPRMAFLDGTLELMTPSRDHERIKSYLGRLIEAYALERGVELTPYGGWTLRQAPRAAGVEPDECYLLGVEQDRDVPDLAIEVVWTSGGLDKLEIYRRLGVREVWFWRAGRLAIHHLEGERYAERDRSTWFPELDLELVVRLLDAPTATQAVRALRDALRAAAQR